jgi:hypothetical protein
VIQSLFSSSLQIPACNTLTPAYNRRKERRNKKKRKEKWWLSDLWVNFASGLSWLDFHSQGAPLSSLILIEYPCWEGLCTRCKEGVKEDKTPALETTTVYFGSRSMVLLYYR